MNSNRDTRIKQANKEAMVSLAVYGLYFLWWYLTGYGIGDTDPEAYSYIFGFPSWFFYSCILGYPLTTVILWLVVRLFFKDIPLDADIRNTSSMNDEDR